jgi:hypothetical protein
MLSNFDEFNKTLFAWMKHAVHVTPSALGVLIQDLDSIGLTAALNAAVDGPLHERHCATVSNDEEQTTACQRKQPSWINRYG